MPDLRGLINAAQAKVREDIQVRCCQIILGGSSLSYAKNLAKLELERLDARRRSLVEKFATTLGGFKGTPDTLQPLGLISPASLSL